MKTLLLLRHATSDPQKEDMADIDRDLSAKGKEEVRDIAKIIKKEGIFADLIISSPARRAIETATIFAEVIRYPVNKVEKKEELYHSKTPEPFLKMIARIDKRYQHVMIVGHNPTVSSLASLLLEHFDYSLPKAGIIGIKFPIKSWKDIMESEGDLALFAFPANIKSDVTMDKKFRKNLESKVTEKHCLFLNMLMRVLLKN